jgi:hypothetical protein
VNQASPPTKKQRGRPSLGKAVPVVLDDAENKIARQMGDGVLSAGVRQALRAVAVIGIADALAAAGLYDKSHKSLPKLDAEHLDGEKEFATAQEDVVVSGANAGPAVALADYAGEFHDL